MNQEQKDQVRQIRERIAELDKASKRVRKHRTRSGPGYSKAWSHYNTLWVQFCRTARADIGVLVAIVDGLEQFERDVVEWSESEKCTPDAWSALCGLRDIVDDLVGEGDA